MSFELFMLSTYIKVVIDICWYKFTNLSVYVVICQSVLLSSCPGVIICSCDINNNDIKNIYVSYFIYFLGNEGFNNACQWLSIIHRLVSIVFIYFIYIQMEITYIHIHEHVLFSQYLELLTCLYSSFSYFYLLAHLIRNRRFFYFVCMDIKVISYHP